MGQDARKPVFGGEGGANNKLKASDQRFCYSLIEKYHI